MHTYIHTHCIIQVAVMMYTVLLNFDFVTKFTGKNQNNDFMKFCHSAVASLSVGQGP